MTDSFVVSGDGTLTRFLGKKNTVEVHKIADGSLVAAIEAWKKAGISSLEIPGSIRRLARHSVCCPDLETVILADGVEVLEPWCFDGCDHLQDVYLPRSIRHIPDYIADHKVRLHMEYAAGVWHTLASLRGKPLHRCYPHLGLMTALRLAQQGKYELQLTIKEPLFPGEFTMFPIPFVARIDVNQNRPFVFQGSRVEHVFVGENVSDIDPLFWETSDRCLETSLQSITVDPKNTTYFSQDGVLYCRDGYGRTVLAKYPGCKPDSHFEAPNHTSLVARKAFTEAYYLQELSLPENCGLEAGDVFRYCPELKRIIRK